MPPPPTEKRRAEPQADTQPRPNTHGTRGPTNHPMRSAPPPRRNAALVMRCRSRRRNRSDPRCPHPLDEVRQTGFWIGAYGFPAERAVVPVPVLLELAELEGRPGEGGKHGSVAGGVVHHEGLSAAASLQLVLLAAADLLIADRKSTRLNSSHGY